MSKKTNTDDLKCQENDFSSENWIGKGFFLTGSGTCSPFPIVVYSTDVKINLAVEGVKC